MVYFEEKVYKNNILPKIKISTILENNYYFRLRSNSWNRRLIVRSALAFCPDGRSQYV